MSSPLVSPNTVLANAIKHAEDVLAPRLHARPPKKIVFVVGTQINGAPHIGTSLIQSLTFAAAARVRESFGYPVAVHFSALDNAPRDIQEDNEGRRYQRAYAQAVGQEQIRQFVYDLYNPLFTELSSKLGVPYRLETYSEQQATEHYRRTWLRLLPRMDAAKWHLAPSTGTPHVRVPCPALNCGWAEKYAERTNVEHHNAEHATVTAMCLHHGPYRVDITPRDGGYLDLATLYRNLVKELALYGDPDVLHVMVKGGDWIFGSNLVDGALHAVGLVQGQLPARLFCPQVVTDTGAKLSKSLIGQGLAPLPRGAAPWMLDTRLWPSSLSEFADRLLGLADVLLSDPRHFFRSYTAEELGRLMAETDARSTTVQ